jgi:hypothetical protein
LRRASAFIEEAYQDTLSLMTELRDYLTETQTEEDRSSEARTHIIREISSITRHMTEAMAWLLLQKAASASEITDEEARTRADGLLEPMAGGPIANAENAALPIELRGYMDRSRRLYDQIIKLREMADKSTD